MSKSEYCQESKNLPIKLRATDLCPLDCPHGNQFIGITLYYKKIAYKICLSKRKIKMPKGLEINVINFRINL